MKNSQPAQVASNLNQVGEKCGVISTVAGQVTQELAYAVQHLFFIVSAPALLFPLGLVLIESDVLGAVFRFAIAAALEFGAGRWNEKTQAVPSASL